LLGAVRQRLQPNCNHFSAKDTVPHRNFKPSILPVVTTPRNHRTHAPRVDRTYCLNSHRIWAGSRGVDARTIGHS